MELEKSKVKPIKREIEDKQEVDYDIVEQELELKYEKKHHDIMYKILKYNPIDWLNKQYRKFLEMQQISEIEGELQWWAAYIYVKEILRLLFDHKIENPYKMLFPEYGPVIVVSNHQSHFDPFFIGASCHRRIRWMSKIENFKTPIVKTLFTNLGAFRLDRDNPEPGWKFAKELINEGSIVGIFPEGTRTDDGSLGEFRTGAVRLAIEKKVPIVPMCVIGSREALPKGKLVLKPARVVTRVGQPIYYDNYDIDKISYKKIKKLTDELRQEVIDLMDGNYHFEDKKQTNELSIGSPQDLEQKPKGNPVMKYLKKAGSHLLQLWDDSWYAVLKSLETYGLVDHFGSFIYNLSGNILHGVSDILFPYKVIDYDKYIPDIPETGALICSNHNSEWDVIILAVTLQKRGHYVYQQAKESLFRIPIVNSWVRSCRAFPLKRGQHDVGSYSYALERLKEGKWIIIYPEGTTNSGGGNLLEGHTGAMRLAIEAKVPIYLIGITGTEDVYPKHAKMLNFNRGVILKAGEPFIEHQKYWDKPMPNYDELKNLTAQMMERIEGLLMYKDSNA